MTSQTDDKTNEFLRRRKIRLQQVREQSKNIARKIRERASAGKLQFIVDTDVTKEREYLKHQDNLIQRLQEYYHRAVDNLGDGHKNASQVDIQDSSSKLDKSKVRGKEAVAELRRKKQEKLDEQKKALDRKLQAREEANEISREKSLSTANKLNNKKQVVKHTDIPTSNTVDEENENNCTNNNNNDKISNVNDMSTQWDLDAVPKEWEPNVPTLNLPQDDIAPPDINNEYTTEKPKKFDLFALSDEMPSSLRGGLTNVSTLYNRPSTLVSEYLQNRDLNLRQPGPLVTIKKVAEDLPKIRQTILRTRSTAASGNINCQQNRTLDHNLGKKQSVTLYNHHTRDTKELPCEDESLVVRDDRSQEDAYSLASKINSTSQPQDDPNKHKAQTTRSKVAVSKLNVEKEYRETVGFLNTLQRTKSPKKVIKNAYKNDEQQQEHGSKQQQKLEYEFKKIENECRRKHNCKKSSLSNRSTSKSPTRTILEEDEESNDFQYSWMPIPESDETLAVHTIPTALRESKVGNNVKFTNIDGYHEYRSRHKHTPPTKDVGLEKKRKTVFIKSKDSSSSITDSSSVENTLLHLSHKQKKDPGNTLTDSEHIVIYKVSNTKHAKHERKQKLINDIIKALKEEKSKECLKNVCHQDECLDSKNISGKPEKNISFQSPKEGIYKTVCENGDSVSNCVMDLKDNKLAGSQEDQRPDNNAGGHCKYTQAQWDIGNKIDRTDTRCTACQCGQCPSKSQISPCTSASSFQTAAIDLINERFTKLIDDKEKESEKLYVGASGLLKNDAYEVVIQLRKKDCSNSQKDIVENTKDNTITLSELNVKEKEHSSMLKSNFKKADHDSPITANKLNHQEKNADTCINKVLEPLTGQKPSNSLEVQDSNTCQPASDSTPIQEIIVNNNNVVNNPTNLLVNDDSSESKHFCQPVGDLRTTYTQTSFSSPVRRSIPIQMSSSASTSYMSPPESILPRYMRNKYCSGDQASQQNIGTEESPDYSYSHPNCHCRDCRHARKVVLKVHHQMQTERKIETPSVKSSITEQEVHFTDTINSRDTRDKRKQCRKKTNHKKAKVHINSISPYMVKPKEINLKKGRESTSLSINTNSHKNRANFNVNPMVISYVDKLLSLNKASLQAIQVVNQDCSSISTPGSSVIDMPNNFDRKNINTQKKISLEQVKEDIIRQLVAKINDKAKKVALNKSIAKENEINSKNTAIKTSKRKQIHKVKSLKVSKKLVNKPKENIHSHPHAIRCNTSLKKSMTAKNNLSKIPFQKKLICCNMEIAKQANVSDKTTTLPKTHKIRNTNNTKRERHYINKNYKSADSSYSVLTPAVKHYENMADEPAESIKSSSFPIHISTQTNQANDDEINFIKVAESKLQNMEKIADLTEKCTVRLSNLAKVLKEVRKNKSGAYNQISTADTNSDHEQKIEDKDMEAAGHKDSMSSTEIHSLVHKTVHNLVPVSESHNETSKNLGYIPLLNNVSNHQSMNIDQYCVPDSHPAITIEQICSKVKGKPPPVLEKSKLKDCEDIIIPHELSTVLEVDSPISVKFKHISSNSLDMTTYNNKIECNDKLTEKCCKDSIDVINDKNTNPDLLQDDKKMQKSFNNSFEHSRAQMIDINQFNKIMLQPFISINDYAKDYKMLLVEETSNMDDVQKGDAIADDMSSLHSEGSLPDVVSELLKRNIITEPFKFDSGNSTTFSSDTTLSMLALSKQKKEQKKTHITFKSKENLADTSDSLSISSNPDLEQAFKKIGMGWASSTLKKTKERLALSSSSNTSSSSISHFRMKNNDSKDIPALVTDSLTSALKDAKKKNLDRSKTIQQQTSFSNSMTVKEFLTNELAKRITFASTSNRSEGDGEFISLCETKMPEEMKRLVSTRVEHSSDQSQNNGNRARTSTPVQLFKSMTYHSSSNSNSSNALFSNVDELSSVKGSLRDHSTSDQDNLTIPTLSLKMKKNSDCSKSD